LYLRTAAARSKDSVVNLKNVTWFLWIVKTSGKLFASLWIAVYLRANRSSTYVLQEISTNYSRTWLLHQFYQRREFWDCLSTLVKKRHVTFKVVILKGSISGWNLWILLLQSKKYPYFPGQEPTIPGSAEDLLKVRPYKHSCCILTVAFKCWTTEVLKFQWQTLSLHQNAHTFLLIDAAKLDVTSAYLWTVDCTIDAACWY
jgi:hypothetical protein